MATIQNEKDKILQASASRVVPVAQNGLILDTFTNNIHTSAVGTLPLSIIVRAIKSGEVRDTVNWTVTVNSIVVPNNDDSITINGDSITIGADLIPPGQEAVVSASVDYYTLNYSSNISITHSIDTVSSSLSTETMSITTDPLGLGGDYSGASTTMSVYIGNVDTSSSWNYSWTLTSGIATHNTTTGLFSRNLKIDALTSDTAKYTCTATKDGWPTQTKSFTISKSKTGQSTSSYWIIQSTANLVKNTAGTVLTPNTVTFTAKTKEGTNAPTNYTGRFTISSSTDGINFTQQDVAGTSSDLQTYTYTPDPADGEVLIKAQLYAAGGTTVLLDEALVTLTSDGYTGADAEILTLNSSAQAFLFTDELSTSSSSGDVTLTANIQNVTGTAVFTATAYDYNNISLGAITLTGTGNTRTLTAANFNAQDTTQTAKVVITATLSGLSDTVTIYRLNSGTNAITALLTNESHTLSADSNGVVPSYTGASTNIKIFKGATDDTSNWTISRVDGSGLTTSISGPTITVTNLDNNTDSAICTITGTRAGYSDVSKIFTVSKSKAGIDGTNAEILTLTSSAQAFLFTDELSTSSSSGDITLTANIQNATGTAVFTATAYDYSNTLLGSINSITLTGTGNTRTLTAANFNAQDTTQTAKVVITATLSGLSDTVTIYRLNSGTDAITALLTNESHTLSADSNGVVSSYTGASTNIKIFKGATDDTSNWTITKEDGSGLTTSISGPTITVTNLDNTTDNAICTITGTRAGYSDVSKIFTVSKSKAGIDGTNSVYYYISSSDSVLRLKDGSFNPSTITFSSYKSTSDAAPEANLVWFKIFENGNTTASYTSSSSETAVVYAPSSSSVTSVTCKIYTDDTFSTTLDIETIITVSDGSSAIRADLSNDNHIFTANTSGTVSVYTGSGTEIRVYEGADELTCVGVDTNTLPAGSTPRWVVSKSATNITPGTMEVSGVYATIGNHSSITADSANIVYTITGRSKAGVGFTITAQQSFSKSKQGATGPSGPAGADGADGADGSNGTDGTDGTDGKYSRKAYGLSSVGTAAATPVFATTTNTAYPSGNYYGLGSQTWTPAAGTPAAGEYLWVTDGIADPSNNQTTWGKPYWAALKVGSLSAITADMGTLTAGVIQGGSATSLTSGTGTYINATDGYFRFGNPTGSYIRWNGSALSVAGDIISTTNINIQAISKPYFSQSAAPISTNHTTSQVITVPEDCSGVFVIATFGIGTWADANGENAGTYPFTGYISLDGVSQGNGYSAVTANYLNPVAGNYTISATRNTARSGWTYVSATAPVYLTIIVFKR